jgi:hypothetical protein
VGSELQINAGFSLYFDYEHQTMAYGPNEVRRAPFTKDNENCSTGVETGLQTD